MWAAAICLVLGFVLGWWTAGGGAPKFRPPRPRDGNNPGLRTHLSVNGF